MKLCVLLAISAAMLPAQIPNLGAPGVPQPMSGDTVVATVGGTNVTIDDVRKMLDDAPGQILQYFRQRPQDFIQQMVLFRYLTEQGDKLKLGEQSPLKEQIEAQRGWIIANAMVNREADAYQVSDEQMNDFYKKNEARWQQAKIKAIFIAFTGGNVVSLDPNDLAAAAKQSVEAAHPANERSQQEAKKLADDIVKQLRAGADFGKLVDQYSDDSTSKQMGGEFPLIKATSPYPEDLKKAIFSMKNGDISDPVLQPAGFYIIRVDQKSLQPLDEVREPILQELRQSHRNDWLNDLNRRFVPVVQKPEFFLQPELYVQKATAPGATAKP